jgi:hypothetical protein
MWSSWPWVRTMPRTLERFSIRDIRDDDIDAEELFFGEHESGVDDEDVVAEAECQTIHAELTEPA